MLYSKADRQDGTPLGIRACRRDAARVDSSYDPRWGKRSFMCRLFVVQHAGYSVGGTISGAKILGQVAQKCFRFLRSNGNRFASMKTVETALNVPLSSASFIRFWFRRRKWFPEVEQLVGIADNGASVEIDGVGDLKAALAYSNHRSIAPYSEQFGEIFGTISGSDVHRFST